jgi:epoxyqueuosine reductase
VEDHCGTCFACSAACPTGAITGPYKVDARRCISYLTIELNGAIPLEYRPLIGNRIYGCDDCQLVCPWNKFAQMAAEPDFARVRNGLDVATLVELFAWTGEEFAHRMEGSAIRRIGYAKWLSNIAIALGNCRRGPIDEALIERATAALNSRVDDREPMVRESVAWALATG